MMAPSAAGRSGRTTRSGGCGSADIFCISPGIESERNGSMPVSSWNSDDSERKQVGLRRDGARVELLGSHVRRRAEDDARARRAAVLEPRDAEVHDPHATVLLVEDDVGRLDVAVNDAALVREIQRIGDARAHLADQARRQHASLGRMHAEVDALDVFHREIDLALVLAGFADLDDVGMCQRPRGVGLAQEPELGLVQQVVRPVVGEREELERDDAAVTFVDRAVDRRGRAAAELLLQAKMVEQLARTESQSACAVDGRLLAGGAAFPPPRPQEACRTGGSYRPLSCLTRRTSLAANRRDSNRQACAVRSVTTLIHES